MGSIGIGYSHQKGVPDYVLLSVLRSGRFMRAYTYIVYACVYQRGSGTD